MEIGKTYDLFTPKGCKSPRNFSIQTHEPDKISFIFSLGGGWQQLVNYFGARIIAKEPGGYNTQKIFGISDTFGNNSVRLGVRASGNAVKGFFWTPILYQHIGGSIYQNTFDFEPQLNFFGDYQCTLEKITDSPWPNQIGHYQGKLGAVGSNPFSHSITAFPVKIGNALLLPSRTSGPYVECFNDKNKKVGSICDLSTHITLL